MNKILICVAILGTACGNSSNSSGVTADVQPGDVQVDDSDAVSDGSDATMPCTGAVEPLCCADFTHMPVQAGCINGTFVCPMGSSQEAALPCGSTDVTDVPPPPDVPDTADTGGCPSDQGGACCCAGDVAANLTCSAGTWTCPKGYGMFYGDQCNGSKCGGPCSLPCAPDAGPTDTGPTDTGPQADGSADPHVTLCTSTGGSVVTAKCCSASSDFPDTCGVGGCSCAPAYLKDIQKCECGAGKCFSAGTGCH